METTRSINRRDGPRLAGYVRSDAQLTGCTLRDAAAEVQRAHQISDRDWRVYVLPYLPELRQK